MLALYSLLAVLAATASAAPAGCAPDRDHGRGDRPATTPAPASSSPVTTVPTPAASEAPELSNLAVVAGNNGNGNGNGNNGNGNGNNGNGNGNGNNGNGNGNSGVWVPKQKQKWQISLSQQITPNSDGSFTPDVPIYDVDLEDTPKSTIDALHAAGKKVICYFSAGTYEDWRADKGDWNQADLKVPMKDWQGESWVDVSAPGVRNVMTKRIALAAEKGCDAIDPDNMDGYNNDEAQGVVTEAQSIDYVKFLSETAAAHGMSTGLKNAMGIIPKVQDYIHFAVNEQCAEYEECDQYASFVASGKAVFGIEYPEQTSLSTANLCETEKKSSSAAGFSTVLKNYNLNVAVQYCDGSKSGSVKDA